MRLVTRTASAALVVVALAGSGCEGNGLPATDGGGDGTGGGSGGDGPVSGQRIGNACELRADAGVYKTVVNPQAPECESQICVKPAVDPQVAATVDTGATCSAECTTAADCANAELRSGKAGDLRCRSGFACGVATETGIVCCKTLCLCKDFLVIPAGGLQIPAGCDANNPVNRCKNLPGR